jgi:hypothetical protein
MHAALIVIGILLILLAITTLTPGRIRFFDDWRVNTHWDQVSVRRLVSFHVADGRARMLIHAERSEDLNGRPVRSPQPRSPRPNMRGPGFIPYRLGPSRPPPPPIFNDFGLRYQSYVYHRDYDWADISASLDIHPAMILLLATIALSPALWRVGRHSHS